jgi:type II secretory pathway pseudopilin PulG
MPINKGNPKLSFKFKLLKSNQSFTLVEFLVVVALIAVLGVAIILTLNPSEL